MQSFLRDTTYSLLQVRPTSSKTQQAIRPSTLVTFIQREIVTAGLAACIPEQWAVLAKLAGYNLDSVIGPATAESSSSSG